MRQSTCCIEHESWNQKFDLSPAVRRREALLEWGLGRARGHTLSMRSRSLRSTRERRRASVLIWDSDTIDGVTNHAG
jgi:hypothetical protein